MSPSYDVYDDAVPINGDEDSPFLGFEYFEKNIQAMDSKIVEDSSFAPLPNKDLFKEFIDVSHIEAVITRLWIQSVAHKTYGRSITAPTHPIQSHEPPTSKPKMLNEEQPVPGKPPPLGDKKFTPSCVFRKGVLATSHSPPLCHNAILLIKPERVFQSWLVRQESVNKIWFPKVSGVVPVILMLPYLSKFITQKIALQGRSFREFQELHLEERLQLLRGLLTSRRCIEMIPSLKVGVTCKTDGAIPRSPYHKEKGLWALLADSNNVWLFKKEQASRQRTMKLEKVLKRTSDSEGEVTTEGMEEQEENENEENYESKYSEKRKIRRKDQRE
ncbi:hypothetical protein HID58_071331 [Brassica napus]|uniref:Uncharacterized protein n=1 Tax=Brassica napus TaxID=3708 RepID=A0ABQ7Z1E3_BRANA|nr:hypothetical protein HID58_071331 [Brassica napus]